MKKQHLYEEIYQEQFSFGKNWQRYLDKITLAKIVSARETLCAFLGDREINGSSIVDIGSGSGIHSLAFYLSGASKVVSLDVDAFSIQATRTLSELFGSRDGCWEVREGSVLDKKFLQTLGQFDIVYSWGVLHHTGDMYGAIDNAKDLVKPGGVFLIALYNHRTRFPGSEFWKRVKYLYSHRGWLTKRIIECFYLLYVFLVALFRRGPLEYFNYIRDYGRTSRGMDFWTDRIDWLGGYPYEYAKPEEIEKFLEERGFRLVRIEYDTGVGCNEFLFEKIRTDK